MARHFGGAPNEAAHQAEREFKASVARKKKSSGRGVRDERFVEVLDEVSKMLAGGEWKDAKGIHFVALYADLHFRVYGVAPLELGTKERMFAAKLATDMLAGDFSGDRKAFAAFIAWTWTREREREAWRRTHARSGGRIKWGFQFGRSLLTEFLMDENRRKEARK